MSIFSPLPENALPGDHARRRSLICLLSALVATPLAVWFFFNPYSYLWANVKLGITSGAAFWPIASLFAIIMIAAVIIAIAGWLLALWYGVESVFLPRERHTPTTDMIITGIGMVAWSLPTLGFLVAAILTPKDSPQDTPVYWQGISFKVTAAGVLAWLAWRYWQGKLHRKPDV